MRELEFNSPIDLYDIQIETNLYYTIGEINEDFDYDYGDTVLTQKRRRKCIEEIHGTVYLMDEEGYVLMQCKYHECSTRLANIIHDQIMEGIL